jgi:hypothetical protein
MGGWVGGWVGGWMEGWVDGWMDGRTDGWMLLTRTERISADQRELYPARELFAYLVI